MVPEDIDSTPPIAAPKQPWETPRVVGSAIKETTTSDDFAPIS